MMAVMVMLYTTVLSTKIKNADGRSGHGGGEAEGQWITFTLENYSVNPKIKTVVHSGFLSHGTIRLLQFQGR